MYNKYTKKSITKTLNNKTLKSNKLFNSTSLLIGCHASTVPSVLDGIKYVESIGGNAVQIFLGSNRSASMKMKTKLRRLPQIQTGTKCPCSKYGSHGEVAVIATCLRSALHDLATAGGIC